MSKSLYHENSVSNIKILAKQMVRKSLGIEDEFDLDLLNLRNKKKDNKSNDILNVNSNSKTKNNNLINLIPKPTKKKIKRISIIDMPNSDTNRTKTKNNQIISKPNLPESKIQDRNSNTINTNTNANTNRNSNINTNQNMTINVNSLLNTNNNSIIEINNNVNIKNNKNINDDDIYSNKNSEIDNKNSKNIPNKSSISENDSDNIENYESNMNENINIDKNSISKINTNSNINTNTKKIYKNYKNDSSDSSESYSIDNKIEKYKDIIEVKIIPPQKKDYLKKDIKDESNNNNYVNKKTKKSKTTTLSLYEREMRNRERKMKNLEKKRNILLNEEVRELRSKPEIDINSQIVISNNEQYIPIYQRALKLHSMKLSKQILNEENNKMKKEIEEKNILNQYKSRSKKFDQEEWNQFIERQKEWKDELQYKRKAAEIFRDNIDRSLFFKPKINSRSRSIIKNLQDGNDSFIDEVFDRLFNDYEEHKERQKLRNEQSLPSFKPKITKLSKNSSQKLFYRNKNFPFKSSTNPIINLGSRNSNNNSNKKKCIIKNNNSKCNTINKTKNNYNKSIKTKSQKLFCDIFNNNVENYLNIKKPSYKNNSSYNNRQLSSKTQGPTQPTNNTNANYTDINTNSINSKYIILEKPLITSINNKNKRNQIKSKRLLHPSNIKKMIEKNCVEQENEEEEDDIINKQKKQTNDKKNKNNYNDFNTNEISEKSVFEEDQSNLIKNNYNDEEDNKKDVQNIEEEDKENENYYNVNMDEIEEEETNKKLPTINESDISIFERKTSLKNMGKNRKYFGQSQNETINSDNSKNIDNNLYKLNIRESTPHMIRQDVILPSNDYSDFFDIPDLDDNDF